MSTIKEVVDNSSYVFEATDDMVERMSHLNELEIEQRLSLEAKKHGVSKATLKKKIKESNSQEETKESRKFRGYAFREEPWPDEVIGKELFDEIKATLERFVVLPAGASTIISLWVIASFAINCFPIFPLLLYRSPDKRCGKSTLLILTGALVNKPLIASNITTSSAVRIIDTHQSTLLIDELDTQIYGNSDLRGFLNAAHRKESAYFVKSATQSSDGDWVGVDFSAWAPIVLAMIGMPPSTVSDRSIHVLLQRKSRDQYVEHLSPTIKADLEHLRQKIQRWVDDSAEALEIYERFSIDGVDNDRTIDNFQPLLKVAKVVDVDIFNTVIGNISTYVEDNSSLEDVDIPIRLLSDIKEIFSGYLNDSIFSADLVHQLLNVEDEFWMTVENNRPLSTTGLAKLLSPFKIQSMQIRIGERTKKGFRVADFDKVFKRYLNETKNAE